MEYMDTTEKPELLAPDDGLDFYRDRVEYDSADFADGPGCPECEENPVTADGLCEVCERERYLMEEAEWS